MIKIPTTLLLDIHQVALCAEMIKAREFCQTNCTEPGEETAAVLFDFCIEHGLTKLAPPVWWDLQIPNSNSHKWYVRTALADGFGQVPTPSEILEGVNHWIFGGLEFLPEFRFSRQRVHFLIAYPKSNSSHHLAFNKNKIDLCARFYQAADDLGLLPPCPTLDSSG